MYYNIYDSKQNNTIQNFYMERTVKWLKQKNNSR